MLIIDNLIKDQKLLSTFKLDETWMNFPSLNWWDGWWKTEPRNIMELVIMMIWKKYANFENEVAGFEYWTNLGGPNSALGWHVDQDIKYYEEKKKNHNAKCWSYILCRISKCRRWLFRNF